MTTPADDWTLVEVREWVDAHLTDGVICPCCGQRAQMYRRKINAGMARALILSWRFGAVGEYIHVNRLGSHETAQLSWWGLIEEQPAIRPDGGRTGWWRPTERGVAWINQRIRVPKYVLVYNSVLYGEPFGELVSIADAIGTKFDLTELLAGV